MAIVTFNEDRCKGCKMCTTACPQEIVIMSKKMNRESFYPATVEEMEKCTGCTACALICPDLVIEVERGK